VKEFQKSVNIWQRYGQEGSLSRAPCAPIDFYARDAVLARY